MLSEVMINKNWSDKEVFQYLDKSLKEKLSSESFCGGWSNNHFNMVRFCFLYNKKVTIHFQKAKLFIDSELVD